MNSQCACSCVRVQACAPAGASRCAPRSPGARPAQCAPAASLQVNAINACCCLCTHVPLCMQLIVHECLHTSCTLLREHLCAYMQGYTRTHEVRWLCMCAFAGEPLPLSVCAPWDECIPAPLPQYMLGVRPCLCLCLCLCPAGCKPAALHWQAQMGLVSGRLLMKVPVRQTCHDDSLVPGQRINLLLGTPGLGPGYWWGWEKPRDHRPEAQGGTQAGCPSLPGEAATKDAAPPAARTQGRKDRAAGQGAGQVRGARGWQRCAAQQGLWGRAAGCWAGVGCHGQGVQEWGAGLSWEEGQSPLSQPHKGKRRNLAGCPQQPPLCPTDSQLKDA